jgi:hypothetical protein
VAVTDMYMRNPNKNRFEERIYPRSGNVDVIDSNEFDALLYVTCWFEVNRDEWRGVKFRKKAAEALSKILNFCAPHEVQGDIAAHDQFRKYLSTLANAPSDSTRVVLDFTGKPREMVH